MTSNRPYLLRALHEWILDNNLTPHVLVDALAPGVVVPAQYVKDGRIVLNLAPRAIRELLIDNQALTFHARFGGTPYHVQVPVQAVLAVYAGENGRGMVLPEEDPAAAAEPEGDEPGQKTGGKPTLKVIK